jgi:hypothetical protein
MMKRFWDAVLGILAPEKYLHNRSLRDGEVHERNRHTLNSQLALQAMELAKLGHAVKLSCTNSGWVELQVIPNTGEPSFTYNGSAMDVSIPTRRGH